MEWSKETLQSALEEKGWPPDQIDIQGGVQFRLQRGATVNLYHTGRTVVGGPVTNFRTEVETFVNAGPQGNGAGGHTQPTRQATDAGNTDKGNILTTSETGPLAANFPELHVDIQVHIDAAASPEQIDHIFASMARHLYGRGE